ncbi:hypothetical protein, partial [Mycobacterium pseudokansasii]|uniref:hypothetical protein n=1 Tax=Mycobacterium pseudokansasii TaxID=2341080 RepID=UPI001B7D6583
AILVCRSAVATWTAPVSGGEHRGPPARRFQRWWRGVEIESLHVPAGAGHPQLGWVDAKVVAHAGIVAVTLTGRERVGRDHRAISGIPGG